MIWKPLLLSFLRSKLSHPPTISICYRTSDIFLQHLQRNPVLCFFSVLKNLQALTPLQKILLNKSSSDWKAPHAISAAPVAWVLWNSASRSKELLRVLFIVDKVIRAKVLGGILLCMQGKLWWASLFSSLALRTKSGLSSHSNSIATTVRRKRRGLSLRGQNIQ